MDGENWREPAELARAYAPAIYRLAYARTGSRADAEDIMQEVFVRLLRTRPDFADRAHARAWLLRVAANCANDWFRAPWRRREGPLTDSLPAPEHEDGDVVEITALVTKDAVIPHRFENIPEVNMRLLKAVKEYERRAARAILTGSRAEAVEALKCNPLVAEDTISRKLVDKYIEYNKEFGVVWKG